MDQPLPARCPRCGGEHELCATCPACGLRGVPVVDGRLTAHQWHRGHWTDGPLDADGGPTPGEWSGGCGNTRPVEA